MSTINFNEEISKLEGALNNFAFKLTKDKVNAKDLYQETIYRALVNQDKFQVGSNLRAWLFTIMRNLFINKYRQEAKRSTVLDATENQFHLNSAGPAVANDANSSIMMKELKGLIKQLDDDIRIPFMMHFYGYKYQEIAEELDLPLGTIKSRIFFARKELKNAIFINYNDALGRPRTA